VSDVQTTTNAPEASASTTDITVKAPGKFARARHATHRGLKRASTDITVWTTATVLTIAEPIIKFGEVVVHTADTKEDAVRSFGRNFIERRHANLIKASETEVETLKRQLAEARALVLAADQDLANNPAPEGGVGAVSLRPSPATS